MEFVSKGSINKILLLVNHHSIVIKDDAISNSS